MTGLPCGAAGLHGRPAAGGPEGAFGGAARVGGPADGRAARRQGRPVRGHSIRRGGRGGGLQLPTPCAVGIHTPCCRVPWESKRPVAVCRGNLYALPPLTAQSGLGRHMVAAAPAARRCCSFPRPPVSAAHQHEAGSAVPTQPMLGSRRTVVARKGSADLLCHCCRQGGRRCSGLSISVGMLGLGLLSSRGCRSSTTSCHPPTDD